MFRRKRSRLSLISVRIIDSGFSAFPPMDLYAVLRLIHNLACKVRLVRVVAPCSADRTLAHQVSQVHCAGASGVWRHTLDMSSLRASLSLPLPHGASPVTMLSHIQRSLPRTFIRIIGAPQKTDTAPYSLHYWTLLRSHTDRATLSWEWQNPLP